MLESGRGGPFITGLPEQLVVQVLEPRLDELRFPGIEALGADGPLPGGVSATVAMTLVADDGAASRELRELLLCAQSRNALVAYVWYLVLDAFRSDEREGASGKAALFRRISCNWVALLSRLIRLGKPGSSDRECDALASGLCSGLSHGALRAIDLGLPRDAQRLGADAAFVGRAHGQLRTWLSGFALALPSPPRVLASSPRLRLHDEQGIAQGRQLGAPRTPRAAAVPPHRPARPGGVPRTPRAVATIGSLTPRVLHMARVGGSLTPRTLSTAPALASVRLHATHQAPALASTLSSRSPRAAALALRLARGGPAQRACALASTRMPGAQLESAASRADDAADGAFTSVRAHAGRFLPGAEPREPAQPPEPQADARELQPSSSRSVARGARRSVQLSQVEPAEAAVVEAKPLALDFTPLELSQLRRRQAGEAALERPSALALPTPPPTRTRLNITAPSPAVAEWIAARSPRAASTPATPRISAQRSVPRPPPTAAQAHKMGAQTYRELVGQSRARCTEWAKAYSDMQDATIRELGQIKRAARAELTELEVEKQRVLELETREYANHLTSAYLKDSEAAQAQAR